MRKAVGSRELMARAIRALNRDSEKRGNFIDGFRLEVMSSLICLSPYKERDFGKTRDKERMTPLALLRVCDKCGLSKNVSPVKLLWF